MDGLQLYTMKKLNLHLGEVCHDEVSFAYKVNLGIFAYGKVISHDEYNHNTRWISLKFDAWFDCYPTNILTLYQAMTISSCNVEYICFSPFVCH